MFPFESKGDKDIPTRQERVSFLNGRGDTLTGVLHVPAEPGQRPAVVLCHGMESNKESEKLELLGRSLSERGLFALRFDFFCSGESSGQFEQITYSGEVEDLRAALDFLRRYPVGKVGLIGSSMGGSVALLLASREKEVGMVVTIAAPAHPERIIDTILTRDQIDHWRQTGFVTYHGRKINSSFLDDLRRINIPEAARKISCPTLIIHGDADETVPVEDARELYDLLSGPRRLCVLEGAGHRLKNPLHFTTATQECLLWTVQHLLSVPNNGGGP